MDIRLINERIRGLCKQRGWSYYRLSKESGFEQSTLKPIIKEKNMPSLHTIERICNAFNITISEFFNDSLFNENIGSHHLFSDMWNNLSKDDKEKVLIYMSGLSHKQVPEDIKNELQ